ncbi:hypothetical protein NDU88_010656 [Pleurodeles waltl]|uniref:Uncharacterized protein n=1 Tax=Pleurodeles waltl TaxID=8319 RepID=A0AAV7PYJ6_PLEWA|nr:hypothetical protein NDU88_010656 [Pleurodeles waltl]
MDLKGRSPQEQRLANKTAAGAGPTRAAPDPSGRSCRISLQQQWWTGWSLWATSLPLLDLFPPLVFPINTLPHGCSVPDGGEGTRPRSPSTPGTRETGKQDHCGCGPARATPDPLGCPCLGCSPKKWWTAWRSWATPLPLPDPLPPCFLPARSATEALHWRTREELNPQAPSKPGTRTSPEEGTEIQQRRR